jgi:pantothenate kinase type III
MTQTTAEQADEWGRSTEQAVNHGINRMLLSLVGSVLVELAADMPDVQIYFTGGDAATMMQHIETDLHCRERPELVLDGLALALP